MSSAATPATNNVRPSTLSNSASGSRTDIALLIVLPYRIATTSTAITVTTATASALIPPARPTPASTAVTSGR